MARITRGTGNVFADLGYADAEERQTKLRLAVAINDVLAGHRLIQAAAAEKLGINQPKVSALANYKLDGFSVERLMTFLTALDQDVEIVIRKKPRSRAASRRCARQAPAVVHRPSIRNGQSCGPPPWPKDAGWWH
jgi:predicted XRE-type DNA-binding protein